MIPMKKSYWFLLVTVFFVLDIGSKVLVATRFHLFDEVVLIPGFFSLTYTTNRGIAFSMLADVDGAWKTIGLTLAAVLAVAYIQWLVWTEKHLDRVLAWGLALITGGILGNILNRLLTGSVVDFLDFHVGSFYWPTFNLADTFISIGAGIVIWRIFTSEKLSE